MYLVDHSPYRAAPAPTTPIARPHYVNGVSYHGGRSFDAVDRVGFEDVDMEMEMRESTTYGDRDARSSRVGGSMSGDEGGRDVEGKGEGEGEARTKEEREARKRDGIVLGVLVLVLVGAIVLFAVLIIEVDKS